MSPIDAQAPAPAKPSAYPQVAAPLILLVGAPNVGKSALFNALTGAYVTVSNYPGTTVGISRSHARLGDGRKADVRDTPGIYSLLPVSEEERVAREAFFSEPADAVIHVVDAKDLERRLPMTLRLLDAGLPVVLAINMIDEARSLALTVDIKLLSKRLGCPVVATAAVTGEGVPALRDVLARTCDGTTRVAGARLSWPKELEAAAAKVAAAMISAKDLPPRMDPRTAAILILEGSTDLAQRSGVPAGAIEAGRLELRQALGAPAFAATSMIVRGRTKELLAGVMAGGAITAPELRERISRFLINPWTGLPVLAVVMYFAFYQVVGIFGAGTLVRWIEVGIFKDHVNPFFQGIFDRWVPWDWLTKLFVGNYGVLTLGITYALALVLPIVSLFFLVFSLVEDSGYFPRLALLVDRLFKKLGLNGRAVIPMILGFGCDTMATITTRTLETKRERVIATLLLSLAIPCSAQLGLIMGILASKSFAAFAFYAACLFGIFMFIGWLTSQVLPGRSATFHMELPPLRLPRIGNVLRKSYSRMQWYFMEVIPLFLIASVILWALDLSGALLWIQRGMEPLMGLLGLPISAAESFLIGFFRRDFAAAGLFKLAEEAPSDELQALSIRQILVASVTLTLFVPCVAQFMMMWKERGPKTALAIFAFVTVFAFAVGTGLHYMLDALDWF